MKTLTTRPRFRYMLSAIAGTALVSLAGLQPALALDPPRFDEASYVRVAVHDVAHEKMDAYRSASRALVAELYGQALYQEKLSFPTVAYRNVWQAAVGPTGERRLPASSYTWATVLDSPLEVGQWQREAERTLNGNPAAAAAWDAVIEQVDRRTVLLLKRRSDLSTGTGSGSAKARGSFSTYRFFARPSASSAMENALLGVARTANRASGGTAHMAVFEVVEGNQGTEFVVVTADDQNLGLMAMAGPGGPGIGPRSLALRQLWNTVQRFEKHFIEAEDEMSYRP